MKLPAVLPEAFLRCMTANDRKSVAPGQSTVAEVVIKSTAKAEKDLQRLIVNYLRVCDIEVLWHRTDKRSHASLGWPDLTFAVNGKAVAWEIKLPGQKPEKHQQLVHERMRANGWSVEVVTNLGQAHDHLGTLTA